MLTRDATRLSGITRITGRKSGSKDGKASRRQARQAGRSAALWDPLRARARAKEIIVLVTRAAFPVPNARVNA